MILKILIHKKIFDCPLWRWVYMFLTAGIQLVGIEFALHIGNPMINLIIFAITNVSLPITSLIWITFGILSLFF